MLHTHRDVLKGSVQLCVMVNAAQRAAQLQHHRLVAAEVEEVVEVRYK